MISVTILVKNGERCLKEVLTSLKNFNEVIVFDTGSTDKTIEIASKFPNVALHQAPFIGFGPSHNAAAACAKNDWILSIDADEVISEELSNEILSLQLDANTIYSFPFFNFFNGKHIKWCGWHPESHIRLYNRKVTSFSEALLHEGVVKKNLKEIRLTHPVYHYSYDSISHFLQKMERYSTLFAEQYQYKRHSSPWIAIYHGLGAFLKSYFLKKGFLGGYEGFIISLYNGHTAFYKYIKLYEANATRPYVSPNRDR